MSQRLVRVRDVIRRGLRMCPSNQERRPGFGIRQPNSSKALGRHAIQALAFAVLLPPDVVIGLERSELRPAKLRRGDWTHIVKLVQGIRGALIVAGSTWVDILRGKLAEDGEPGVLLGKRFIDTGYAGGIDMGQEKWILKFHYSR